MNSFNFCYGFCNKLWLTKLALLSSSQAGGWGWGAEKDLCLLYTVIVRSKSDYVMTINYKIQQINIMIIFIVAIIPAITEEGYAFLLKDSFLTGHCYLWGSFQPSFPDRLPLPFPQLLIVSQFSFEFEEIMAGNR